MDKLDILSVNVRGLNTTEKRNKIYDWLCDIKTDIVFLQETHFIEKNEYRYNARWFGDSYHCFSDSSFSRGVSILFRKNLPLEVLNVHKSLDGRKILLNIKIDNDIITLVNIYAPNNEQYRLDFFKRLQSFINQYALNIENVIMCGDFNCSFTKTSDKSVVKLSGIARNLNFVDLWNEKHEHLSGFTWCDAANIPKSRIDYIFLSNNFVYDVKQIIVRKIPGTHSNGCRLSDHRALKKNQKGTGYWKLNTSYLENDDYVKGIKDIIQNVINNVNGSHIVKWETLKYDVKQFSLKFAKQFQKNIKQKILYLGEAISNIEDSFSGDIDMTKKKKTRTGIV